MKTSKRKGFSRRRFMIAAASVGAASLLKAHGTSVLAAAGTKREVFIVPNFHPASCGWLTNFSRERVYCANSYLDHLDRVRDDPQYEFVMSEVNNIIAIMNFKPERIPELKQRLKEKRVELVNGFFLESTINLSGGEALVRMGVEGLNWYEHMFGIRPRFAWCIDTCGVHDQMAQIASGLGLEALIYTRNNPVGQTLFWTESPDGTRILTLCPGSYHEARSIFDSKQSFTKPDLDKLEEEIAAKDEITPRGAPLILLGGGADYSLAPKVKSYPSAFIDQWTNSGSGRNLRFATLSRYIDSLSSGVNDGSIPLQTHKGGTAYDYDAFWIECPQVKVGYRQAEQNLQRTESLATIASLTSDQQYPAQDLYDAWILMFLNTDRNTLWGSAGGMVFESKDSWDVRDRLAWVNSTANLIHSKCGGGAGLSSHEDVLLYNPLNWARQAPCALTLPDGTHLHGVPCETLANGTVLCSLPLDGLSLKSVRLAKVNSHNSKAISKNDAIQTQHYSLLMDQETGAIASLKLKQSGRELFHTPGNVIIAERPKTREADPGDLMPPIPERLRLGTTDEAKSTIAITEGNLATTIVVTGTFYGGSQARRTLRLYHAYPRIDFVTELTDIPDNTVVFADFPFAFPIEEVRRGIPFGFSHAAWVKPNAALHGWAKGIVPALRWIDYSFAGGGGAALFDKGLTGRELNGQTASIYLLNAEDKYHGYENSWLSGKGKHVLEYALFPHESNWQADRVAQAAWEYNLEPAVLSASKHLPEGSYLETSDNVIVESLRRQQNMIILRMVEAFGVAAEAKVRLNLPHKSAFIGSMTGDDRKPLGTGPEYRLHLRPQQIVTLMFEATTSVPKETPVQSWDRFVPPDKLHALHAYDPSLIGHPPFGDG
jgi:hypothetical protein